MRSPSTLADVLFQEGFGTRRLCVGLVERGLVRVGGEVRTDPASPLDSDSGDFEVDGLAWRRRERVYVMLHKPPGYECSLRPSAYPGVHTLLPAPLRQRPQKGGAVGVQAVGRLDQDTTGLLLLSDDGTFIHRMSSPRHHVSKVYDVQTKHPVDDAQIDRLCKDVVLDNDPTPVRAAACEATGERALRLTLTEGRYHQVKRMVAAVGNRVEALHRSRIGGLSLPDDLAPGAWRFLEAEDLAALRGS